MTAVIQVWSAIKTRQVFTANCLYFSQNSLLWNKSRNREPCTRIQPKYFIFEDNIEAEMY